MYDNKLALEIHVVNIVSRRECNSLTPHANGKKIGSPTYDMVRGFTRVASLTCFAGGSSE